MVQTKAPIKLSPQNRGADLKKKMKKSRPFKRSDSESFRSTSIKKEIPQPGTSPPFDDPATPEKQFPIRSLEASPNYMKSTSSFEARKASSNKTQLSSSKRVRSLTQTPSFKPARAYSAKKCSPVALCENLSNVQRETCSSTLKNSKFPSYLGLSPGATESEGSSAVKVCPYTFCSLNGHLHRASLPPLKTFLTARRRMLKTQKSMKLKPKIQEMGLDGLERKSAVQENQMDFFIEIYANDAGGGSKLNRDEQGQNKFVANDSIVDFETDPETSDMEWDDGNSDISSSVYPILKIGHINFDEITVDEGPEEIFEQEGGNEGYDSAGPFPNSDSYISMENQEDKNKVSEADNESPRMGNKTEMFSNKGEALIDGQDDGQDDEFVLGNEGQDEVYQSNVNDEEIEDSETDQRRKQEEPVLPEITTTRPNCISGISEADHEMINEENNESNQAFAIEDQNPLEKNCHEPQISEVSDFVNSEDRTNLVLNKVIVAGNSNEDDNEPEAERSPILDPEEIFSPAKFAAEEKAKAALFRRRSYPIQEFPNLHNNMRIIRDKRPHDELGEITRKFNPREPNFLLLEPDPEAERVDLRHRMMDERKNAEEWMIDYALQRVVTKLGPARKKKVALLVEAFEKVMPMPEHDEPLLRRASSGSFPHRRTIQACI